MRAVLGGSRRAGVGLGVGDPFLSWLYQPAVRTFRVRLYGDDLSFLQAGLPATFTSDSTFTRFYPWYHEPTDTPDKLDAAALDADGDRGGGRHRRPGRAPGHAGRGARLVRRLRVRGGRAACCGSRASPPSFRA